MNPLNLHIDNHRLVIQALEDVWRYKSVLDTVDIDMYDFLIQWFGRDESIRMQTSGSTGEPKIIYHTKAAMLVSAENTLRYFNLQTGDKALLCLPSRFVAGKMMLVRAMMGGLELVCVAPSGNPLMNLTQAIKFAAMTPHQVIQTIRECPEKLHDLETLIIGGGEVNLRLIERLNMPDITTKCFSTFGMTETITHIALRQLNPLSSSYKTLPGITVFETEKGTLGIYAPYIQEQPILTNDVIKMEGENAFQWLGRLDNVINSGGVKLHPELIEQKMSTLMKGVNFYLTGQKDDELGEIAVLVVETKEDIDLPDWSQTLSKYECPKEVIFVDEFQRTPTGKVIRKKL